MNIDKIKELTEELNKLSLELKKKDCLDNVPEKDRITVAALIHAADEFVKDAKNVVRAFMQAGGSMPGAKLGAETVSLSISDYPGVKDQLCKLYGLSPSYVDKYASLTLSNLYKLDREGCKDDGKSDDKIKSEYKAYMVGQTKTGSLKI